MKLGKKQILEFPKANAGVIVGNMLTMGLSSMWQFPICTAQASTTMLLFNPIFFVVVVWNLILDFFPQKVRKTINNFILYTACALIVLLRKLGLKMLPNLIKRFSEFVVHCATQFYKQIAYCIATGKFGRRINIKNFKDIVMGKDEHKI